MSETTEATGADPGQGTAAPPEARTEATPAAPSKTNGEDGQRIWAKAETHTTEKLLKRLGVASLDEARALLDAARSPAKPALAADDADDEPEKPAAAPAMTPKEIRRLQRERDEKDAQLATEKKLREKAESALTERQRLDRERDVAAALTAAFKGAHDPADLAALYRGRVELTGDGDFVVNDVSGKPTTATLEELAAEIRKSKPWTYPATTAAGAGSPPPGGKTPAARTPTAEGLDLTTAEGVAEYRRRRASQ